MKEMTLTYNRFGDRYVFYEGKRGGAQRNRKEWEKEVLIANLKKTINLKRKSTLYLTEISEDVFPNLIKLLKNTRVNLILEDKI